MDLTEGSTVLQNFPRFVGVIVDLDQILVADGKETIAFKIGKKIIGDGVLIQTSAFDQKLCVITEFKHSILLYKMKVNICN